MLRLLFRIILGTIRLLRPGYFAASRPVEGNAAHFEKGEAIWWAYKYFCRQIEEPERGRGIGGHFARQTLDFSPPPGFSPEAAACIAAGGDILPTDYIHPGSAVRLWEDVEDFYFSADLCYANLESPVDSSRPLSGVGENILAPPLLNNSPETFELYRRGGKGIRCCSTANNHALDMGPEGLLETLAFLDRREIIHVGTSRSEAERDNFPVIEIRGIRIALLSYTFSLNRRQVPPGREYLVNHLRLNKPDCDISPIRRHIAAARKERRADIIIAFLHWGLENESYPIQNNIDRGHALLEAGIDVIIGNHPHTLQPAEEYAFRDPETGQERQGLILYALGDLVSWEPVPNTRLSALARIHLEKGRQDGLPRSRVSGVELKPVYLYSAVKHKKCSDFRVMDLAALASAVEQGKSPVPLTKKQQKEVQRLRALQRKILPAAG
jgi:poly-gamma-glutamate synthesis protein (capsule biosynthesis protein)